MIFIERYKLDWFIEIVVYFGKIISDKLKLNSLCFLLMKGFSKSNEASNS